MKLGADSIGNEQGTERKMCSGSMHHLFPENLRWDGSVKGLMGTTGGGGGRRRGSAGDGGTVGGIGRRRGSRGPGGSKYPG